jgi:hypothetical protein
MENGAEAEQFSRAKRLWLGGGISAKSHRIKN